MRCALATALLLLAGSAAAARLVPMAWTVGPGRCTGYQVEKWTGSAWVATSLFADSTLALKAPRFTVSDTAWADSGYVNATQSGIPTTWRCHCVGGPANNVAAAIPKGSFARDTVLYGWAGELWRSQLLGMGIAGPMRGAGWRTFNGDTLAPWVEFLDAEQSRLRDWHCTLFGYYWQHGARMVCVP
jgi:hypothetical protein